MPLGCDLLCRLRTASVAVLLVVVVWLPNAARAQEPDAPAPADEQTQQDQPVVPAEAPKPSTIEMLGSDAPDISELSLEDLLTRTVRVASKKEEGITETSSVVTTVSAQEIAAFGANNLLEVLERVAGVTYIGSYLQPQNVVSIRGDLPVHYNVHVLVLINGRPTRESLYGGIDFSIFHAFPLATIDRIEVVRGPGAALYGTNAYAGVINIVTKRPTVSGGTASVGYGSFGAVTLEGAGFASQGDLKLTSGIKLFRDHGWGFEAVDEVGADISSNRNQRHLGAQLGLEYKGLTLDALLASSAMGIVGVTPNRVQPGPPDPYPQFAGRENDAQRYLIDLGYRRNITEDIRGEVHATFNAFDHRIPATTGDHVGASKDILFEATAYHQITKDLSYLVGGTAWLFNARSRIGDDVGRGIAYLAESWFTGYLEAQYRPIKQLKLIAGGQINKAGDRDANAVPRAGAVFNITDELGVKFQFGQAYRSANAAERFLSDAPVITGRSDLTPETVTNFDAQVFYYSQRLQLGLAAFHSKSTDLITRVALEAGGPFTFSYVNGGEFVTKGGELEAKVVPITPIFITGSVSYQENTLTPDGGTDIENYTSIPTLMGKLGVSYHFLQLVNVGVFYTHFSKPEDVSNVNPARIEANPSPTAVNLLSAKVSFDIAQALGQSEHLGIAFYGTNLLDESVNYPEFARRNINALPGRPGRAGFVQLTGSF